MIAKYITMQCAPGHRAFLRRYRNLGTILHWHRETELVLCHQGNAQILLEGIPHLISAGQGVYIHGGIAHEILSQPNSVTSMCVFDAALTASLTDNFTMGNPVFALTEDVLAILREIQQEQVEKTLLFEEKIQSLLTGLLIALFRLGGLQSLSRSEHMGGDYCGLLNLIDSNYPFLTFQDAAAYMNLSGAYFSRYFKAHTGMTFSRYLNQVRVEKAIDQMWRCPDMKLADISANCGFGTLRSFNRIFREQTGYAPTALPKDYKGSDGIIPGAQSAYFRPILPGTEFLGKV